MTYQDDQDDDDEESDDYKEGSIVEERKKLEQFQALFEIREGYIKGNAKLLVASYNALIEEGFTEEQAFKYVMQNGVLL